LEQNQVAELECGQCGIPLDTLAKECPKCGEKRAVRQDGKKYLEVDVAHTGETVERALAKLNQAASEALAGAYQGLKVVHGYGSGHNHTHLIKEAVWKRLLALQKKYGGRLIQDGNSGATQWQIVQKRQRINDLEAGGNRVKRGTI
jgi:dsDNA-specific endonuclease/ATPase MutS2